MELIVTVVFLSMTLIVACACLASFIYFLRHPSARRGFLVCLSLGILLECAGGLWFKSDPDRKFLIGLGLIVWPFFVLYASEWLLFRGAD
jgi:hypothetical protein